MFSVYTDGCNDLEARLRLPDGSRRTRLSIKSIEHVKRQVEGAVARESLRLESGLILLAIAVSGGPSWGCWARSGVSWIPSEASPRRGALT